MTKRWTYVADSPGQLVDGEFVIDLEPGQEFDAPDSFQPFPNPHPVFQPVKSKSAPAPAPQE